MNLFEACQWGHLDRVVELINLKQASVNDTDEKQALPLHWAAINNHIAIAQFLLDNGAAVDAFGGEINATALHWACRQGNIQMATYLVKRGANPLLKESQGYNTLHLAVHGGHTFMITFLLAIGVPVDGRDALGRTPLMWSAYQGNSLSGMEELIRNACLLDLVDSTGFTALHWAAISHHFELAALLCNKGANTEIRDPEGKSAEDWAAECGASEQWKRILSDCGKLKTTRYSHVHQLTRNPQTSFCILFHLS